MKNYFDLTGQVAVVTGCSTGLGVQMAKALANQGAKIVAIARRKELIDAVAKEIAEEYKVEAVGIQCDITDEQFYNEINIDMFGSFRMARAIAKKAMIPAKYGRIINIASMYGMVGNKVAPCSPYHAAKGGVVNMTRGLASEWGKYNINVNAICPGYFYSPLTKETLDSDFFQQNAQTMIPLSRYGNEGELDTAALFLASPASSYVTGVILPVDGGYTAM